MTTDNPFEPPGTQDSLSSGEATKQATGQYLRHLQRTEAWNRKKKRWLPFGISLLTMPVLMLIGQIAFEIGYGPYEVMAALFPWMRMAYALKEQIGPGFEFIGIIGLLQYQIYGGILTLLRFHKWFLGAIFALMVIHALSVLIAFQFQSDKIRRVITMML